MAYRFVSMHRLEKLFRARERWKAFFPFMDLNGGAVLDLVAPLRAALLSRFSKHEGWFSTGKLQLHDIVVRNVRRRMRNVPPYVSTISRSKLHKRLKHSPSSKS